MQSACYKQEAIVHLRAADPRLDGLIQSVGDYSIAFHPPEFSTLARSIVFQQLSTKAASTIFGRLTALLSPAPLTAAGIAALTTEQLRGAGISLQKAGYLRSLAERTLDGTIDFASLPSLSDDDVVAHLTTAKGVGVWTAHMFLMFALQRPDVLPTGDLGIRNAVQKLYRLRTAPTPAKMQRIAKPWRPYSSVACWYLWRSLDNVAAL